MRILVADQDMEHRRSLVNNLQNQKHTVREALTARDVVEECRTKCPHLIFVDKELSGTSGIDIIRQIRQLGGHAIWVPIIYIGKNLTENEIVQSLDAGADDFLEKPLSPLHILAKVRAAERQQNLKDEVFSVAHNLVVANRALESLVTQDSLTGIGNSNTFDDNLEKNWFSAKKNNTPLSLFMANLDFFQAYNQTYGAVKGDEVIKQVATALKNNLTNAEYTVARLTGDTFAILLPNTGSDEAKEAAEKLKTGIEELNIPHINSGCSDHVTASFGVSSVEPGHFTSPWDLKEAADYALFQAKHYGRNKVYFVPIVENELTK